MRHCLGGPRANIIFFFQAFQNSLSKDWKCSLAKSGNDVYMVNGTISVNAGGNAITQRQCSTSTMKRTSTLKSAFASTADQ